MMGAECSAHRLCGTCLGGHPVLNCGAVLRRSRPSTNSLDRTLRPYPKLKLVYSCECTYGS